MCVNTTRDLGAMNQWLTSRKIVREAALIADRMGLRAVRTLEVQDIIDIWNAGKAKGLTDGISKKDEHSFKTADLIIEARADDDAPRHIAVATSFAVDERDTRRALRHAEYISKFTGTPTYAAVAGISSDNSIDEVLADIPEPYDSEHKTRVFWSRHGDIS